MERVENLKKLLKEGKMSPKLKKATKELISALEKGNNKKIQELSYIHQHISSGYGLKEYPYNEDDDHNRKVAGTTAYEEFDAIWHGEK